MKNIHLLSTEKPSRLIIYSTLLNEFRLLDEPIEDWKHKKNIYITSDEEIKVGDYFIESLGLPDSYLVHKLSKEWKDKESFYRRCTKVILTTDADLIEDRVESIDDEFLEWFVKNPTCEEVEIESWKIDKEWDKVHTQFNPIYPQKTKYKIIIPKEEPKQLFTKGDKVLFTGKMLDEEVIDKVVTVFYTLGRGEVEDMSDIMDEYTHIYRVWNKDLKHIPKQEPKQETLEEAAERLYQTTIDSFTDNGFDLSERERLIFINGAEWQQERMYSEEDFKLFARLFYREIKLDKSNLLWDELADKCFEQFKQMLRKI